MSTPDQIGRYRLERRLGSGAFGTVWLAHDDSLESLVAVKVMAENWAYRLDLRERFLAEARLLRRAASNGLVQVFDIGELPDERPYFVMEYADQGTLEDRLTSGPLAVAEALRVTAEASRGVAALHKAGIVHRDIKPSNVLIRTGPSGEARLLVADLGLAKTLAHASGLTLAVGSPGYMAPEQAEPDAGIDARADVYGLGALLYHLATGQVPGPPGKVVRPQRLRPELPDGVQKVILRALEPDRERRWPDASSLASELDALAEQAEQADLPQPRKARRVPVIAAVTATVMVAAGGGIIAGLKASRQPSAWVQVSDETGSISLKVPTQWSRQLVNAGWNPNTLGLEGGHKPGLTVAGDVRRWQDPDAEVDGVFVGLGGQDDLVARVGAITHRGCGHQSKRDYDGAAFHGTVRSWSDCAGSSDSTIEEIGLTGAKGGGPQVYVQVRQDGGEDVTDRILDDLKVRQ